MPSTKTPRYKYKPPKAEMRAIDPYERHPIAEGIASGLGYLRDSLDSGNILDVLSMGPMRRALDGDFTPRRPPTTHSGLGSLTMGRAPEELHDEAAGFSPFSEEPNYGNILDPRIKAGREQGLTDLAFLGDTAAAMTMAPVRGAVTRGLRGIGMRSKVNPIGGIIDTAPVRSDGLDAVVGRGRLPLIHGSNNNALTLGDVDILRTGQRQSQRSNPVGGFYMSNPEDLAHAEGYAKMRNRGASPDASVDPTIYDMGVRQGTKVLRINGSTDRLSQNYIKELQSQGYGLVVGKDVRGRTEYVAIDKNALETMNPRRTEPDAPADMSRRAFLGNTGKVAGGLAAASVLPFALRGAEHAAPAVVEHAIPAAAARQATLAEWTAANQIARANAQRAMDLVGLPRDSLYEASRAYKLALEDEMARLKNSPHFKDFETPHDIHLKEAQELDDLEKNYDASNDRQNPYDGADYGEDWENYMYRRHEVEDKYANIMREYDQKHGYIDNNEVYNKLKEDPNFKYVDPYSHNELTWVKFDKNKHEWVKTEFNPSKTIGSTGQMRGYINPENGLAYPNNINRHTHPELSAEYFKKYLRDREIPHAKGGSVTMPDNYRAGGRVRVI
jgi:hypothetical protein